MTMTNSQRRKISELPRRHYYDLVTGTMNEDGSMTRRVFARGWRGRSAGVSDRRQSWCIARPPDSDAEGTSMSDELLTPKQKEANRQAGHSHYRRSDIERASMADSLPTCVRDRAALAVQEAEDAYWEKVVEHFPEVKSGDFGPGETHVWETTSENSLVLWLYWNHPESKSGEDF